MTKEIVDAEYFAKQTGVTVFRSSQILNLKGYRLEKTESRKPMYPKDKVDALATIYIDRMRPLSELEATREDLQRVLGVDSGRKVRLLMTHKQFPKPHRMFMKVATGAPPVKVWLISDLKAIDVKKLLAEVVSDSKSKKKNKDAGQLKSAPKFNIDNHFLAFVSGRYMKNIQSQIEA